MQTSLRDGHPEAWMFLRTQLLEYERIRLLMSIDAADHFAHAQAQECIARFWFTDESRRVHNEDALKFHQAIVTWFEDSFSQRYGGSRGTDLFTSRSSWQRSTTSVPSNAYAIPQQPNHSAPSRQAFYQALLNAFLSENFNPSVMAVSILSIPSSSIPLSTTIEALFGAILTAIGRGENWSNAIQRRLQRLFDASQYFPPSFAHAGIFGPAAAGRALDMSIRRLSRFTAWVVIDLTTVIQTGSGQVGERRGLQQQYYVKWGAMHAVALEMGLIDGWSFAEMLVDDLFWDNEPSAWAYGAHLLRALFRSGRAPDRQHYGRLMTLYESKCGDMHIDWMKTSTMTQILCVKDAFAGLDRPANTTLACDAGMQHHSSAANIKSLATANPTLGNPNATQLHTAGPPPISDISSKTVGILEDHLMAQFPGLIAEIEKDKCAHIEVNAKLAEVEAKLEKLSRGPDVNRGTSPSPKRTLYSFPPRRLSSPLLSEFEVESILDEVSCPPQLKDFLDDEIPETPQSMLKEMLVVENTAMDDRSAGLNALTTLNMVSAIGSTPSISSDGEIFPASERDRSISHPSADAPNCLGLNNLSPFDIAIPSGQADLQTPSATVRMWQSTTSADGSEITCSPPIVSLSPVSRTDYQNHSPPSLPVIGSVRSSVPSLPPAVALPKPSGSSQFMPQWSTSPCPTREDVLLFPTTPRLAPVTAAQVVERSIPAIDDTYHLDGVVSPSLITTSSLTDTGNTDQSDARTLPRKEKFVVRRDQDMSNAPSPGALASKPTVTPGRNDIQASTSSQGSFVSEHAPRPLESTMRSITSTPLGESNMFMDKDPVVEDIAQSQPQKRTRLSMNNTPLLGSVGLASVENTNITTKPELAVETESGDENAGRKDRRKRQRTSGKTTRRPFRDRSNLPFIQTSAASNTPSQIDEKDESLMSLYGSPAPFPPMDQTSQNIGRLAEIHIPLMYHLTNIQILCRTCLLHRKHKIPLSSSEPLRYGFAVDASLEELWDHCETEHPEVCAELAGMTATEIRYMLEHIE